MEIDRPLATPNTTKPMLGGMIGPMIPPAAIRPAERALSWPALTIIGTSKADERRGVGDRRSGQSGEQDQAAMIAT